MVLGVYYLTASRPGAKGEGKVFRDYNEAYLAYDSGVIDLHALIKVRMNGELVETTVGRLIFHKEVPVPNELGFYNQEIGKKQLGEIVAKCYKLMGEETTAKVLDGIKRIGFHYSTKAGITIGITDIVVPEAKKEIINTRQHHLSPICSHSITSLIKYWQKDWKIDLHATWKWRFSSENGRKSILLCSRKKNMLQILLQPLKTPKI